MALKVYRRYRCQNCGEAFELDGQVRETVAARIDPDPPGMQVAHPCVAAGETGIGILIGRRVEVLP